MPSAILPFPAPVGGLNFGAPLGQLQASEARIFRNLDPTPRGLSPRKSPTQHYSTATPNQTRTIFQGGSRLFAADANGIWNVTAGSGTPGVYGTSVYSFGLTSGDAGYCTWTGFSNAADRYLFVGDEVNGLVRYNIGANTWAVPAITGVSAGSLVCPVVFKGRLWAIERGTSRAWYLAAGSIAGAATSFDFGPKFMGGGQLAALASWTQDGGAGMDDHLLAISTSGDVLVYVGNDPASASTFQIAGAWNLGAPGAGRRFLTDIGGDVLVITERGPTTMSNVVAGKGVAPDQFSSQKLAGNIQGMSWGSYNRWELTYNQKQNQVWLWQSGITPGVQYVYHRLYGAWSTYDLSGYTFGVLDGVPYFVGTGGAPAMYRLDGTSNVTWSIVSAQVDPAAGKLKRPVAGRVKLSSPSLSYTIEPRMDASEAEATSGNAYADARWRGFAGVVPGFQLGYAAIGSAASGDTIYGAEVMFDAGEGL